MTAKLRRVILFFMADLVTGELFVRVEYGSSEVGDALPYVGVDHIWRAVRAMNGQLNWQTLLNLGGAE
jgi:hypothetical protein